MRMLTAALCLAALAVPAGLAAGATGPDANRGVPRSVKGGVRSINDPPLSPEAEKTPEKPTTPWEGQSEMPGWVSQNRAESVHFTLMMDAPDDQYAERFLGDMERQFSVLQKEFWDFIPPRWREAHIDVVAFATQEAFDDYAGRDGGLPRGEKGYSSAREPRIVFLRQGVYYRDVMIVVHEMTHVFNRFCLAVSPLWLDEGMAQYYANYAGESAGNKALVSGVNPEALVAMDGASGRGALVPFAVLMKMPESIFYGEDSGLNYAQSWALVYWMRRGLPDGDALFTSFYAAIARGRDGLLAFSENYGYNHHLVGISWMGYLQRLYKDRVVEPLQPEAQKNDKPADAR